MSTLVVPSQIEGTSFAPVVTGGLQSQLQKTGRLPPVTLQITPIDGTDPFTIDGFLSYQFSQSVLIPVSSFSFNFVAPDDPNPSNFSIKEGDIVTLFANGVPLATGLIDTTDVETDDQFGEKIMIQGRDLNGQLEDQDAVGLDSTPVYAKEITLSNAVAKLTENTRIQGFNPKGLTPKNGYLLATEPGESKLSALQRFVDPLNLMIWSDPTGLINIGKPNMKQDISGQIFCIKKERRSNVVSIKAIRSSATIPNIVTVIWTGQELVQNKVQKKQVRYNPADGPERLRLLGHRLPKAVVISTPQGATPQELSDVNLLNIAHGNLLDAHGKREFARHNQKELIVQAVVPGHYNDSAQPWQVDTIYQVTYDRGDVNDPMYLFQVEYSLDEQRGQITSLFFCPLGSIVADIEAK